MPKKSSTTSDVSTEQKIIEAARQVFTKKGYSATRTRDIAEAAGLNLALLNYYFRSKEKLFEMVMIEKMLKFFGVLAPVLNDDSTTLEKKVEVLADQYTELLLKSPDLPLFVLSEIRNSPKQFASIVQKTKFLKSSVFIRQIEERKPGLNPLQFLISILGMCVFPFIMKPVLEVTGTVNEKEFKKMMLDRKELIPAWTKAMLKSK